MGIEISILPLIGRFQAPNFVFLEENLPSIRKFFDSLKF